MKLMELSTDKALDVLCELTPYVSGICSDSELLSTLGEKTDSDENMNTYEKFALLAGRIGEFIPLLLNRHRSEIYGILSVLSEKSVEEISAQRLRDTRRQVEEAFQDNELLDFFKSFTQQEQSGPSVPSADSPASE